MNLPSPLEKSWDAFNEGANPTNNIYLALHVHIIIIFQVHKLDPTPSIRLSLGEDIILREVILQN